MKFLHLLFVHFAAASLLIFSASAQAPAPGAAPPAEGDISAVFSQAMQAFTAGDYQTAASNLEKVITDAGPAAQSKLESVYFTLGAAYFNIPNFPQAIATLKKYVEKFPQGAKIADAKFSLGQAYFLSKDYNNAAATFKQLEDHPQLREQALLFEGMAQREAKQVDQAIATLGKLVSSGINDTNSANGAILLASLYAEKNEGAKAMAMIEQVRRRVALLDNVARLNALAVELGDKLLQTKMPKEALACYRAVRSRDEVIKFQSDRIAAIQKKIEQNKAAIRPDTIIQITAQNKQLATTIEENKKLLEEFQKLPNFDPGLLIRLATCFYQMDKKWASVVVYEEFLRKYPEDPNRETALFGLIVASAETNRVAKTRELCEQYLRDFKDKENAGTVGFLLGATALQSNDLANAEQYLGRMLAEQPKSAFREEMRYLLANARFGQGKYEEALKDYQEYQKEFPKGSHLEEVIYRIPLCSIFMGKYENGMNQITEYIKKYPQGSFLADARYRLAVCKYAAQLHDEVIADMKNWQKDHGNESLLAEVLALEADCHAAKGDDDQAVALYIRSYKAATSDEILNYSLTAAQKLLQKKGQWDKIGEMFQEFVEKNPEHPMMLTAIHYIGKARVREGKVDEAKKYIADTIKKYIADPKRDAVEQLLSQLAQLCVRKKAPPAVAAASPAADAGPGASPTPPTVAEASPAATPAVDPGLELDKLLGGAEVNQSPTARARVFYAKAELARLRKQNAEMEKNLQAIADKFKPEDLSAMLLAQVGDFLLEKKQFDKAEPVFKYLMDEYPKGDVLDFAYNGLGQIAYEKKDYQRALKLFTDAIEKVGAQQKLKDVTVGRAKTLLAMDRLDEAKKLLEQIASVREWRGESTAFAVFSLGEIAEKKNDLPGAVAYYQRVYVGYQRFLPWVAKAYIKSAECFEKLNKTQEAQNTYREMIRNEKLANFPETQIARKRMQEAG